MQTVKTLNTSASWIPFTAATDDLRFLDEGFADVLDVVHAHGHAPSLVETRGAAVESITGAVHADTPVWLITLGREYSGRVQQLAASTPVVSSRTSADLRTRRTTIEWQVPGVSVCAYADGLQALEDIPTGDSIIVIFATKKKTAVTELQVNSALLLDLYAQDRGNHEHYNAAAVYSAQELSDAFVESVLFANRPRVDAAGNLLVNLTNYSYLYDSIS